MKNEEIDTAKADAFSFEGHVSEETFKPYVPWDAFADLAIGTILTGVVDHISSGDVPRVQVVINGHLTGVPVWGADVMKVVHYVGKTVNVAFSGMNGKYPKLSLMLR